jgi:hypothetical protein
VLAEEDLVLLIAASLGADPTMVVIDDYGSLVETRRRGRQRSQRAGSTYEVTFRVFTNSVEAEELQAVGLSSAMSNFSQMLGQLHPSATLIGARSKSVTRRLSGEHWKEIGGAFMLQSCPVGHLLVNTTIDLQSCLECDPGMYTLDMASGCVDGICSDRSCQECPVGVDCARGLNPPWMHFVPKVLKIGLYPFEWLCARVVCVRPCPSL